MKNSLQSISKTCALRTVVGLLVVCAGATALKAEVWRVTAGGQNGNLGSQALGFLPNELWIHAGDGIQWSFGSDEIHTVTFLGPGQIRPPLYDVSHNFIGCPGVSQDRSTFTGAACVTSARSIVGQTFTVYFSLLCNFKLVCLVHSDITGALHVFVASVPSGQVSTIAGGPSALRAN